MSMSHGFADAKERLSREVGTIVKDWGGRLPFAIIYPNSYHIGMSNLGLQAIYSLLNAQANAVCERVFWDKPAKKITEPLSVESQRPLTDFSVLAFTVSYELDYFNVPQILKASGIPVFANERDENHPLVIAGGPCITANPAPLAPFFDCLCLGEAEALLPKMLPVLYEKCGGSRSDLLQTLAALPGVYVPQVKQELPILRQSAANLDDFPVHSVVLTPDTELGELYMIEVERGCSWGCRFCLVNSTFSPMRFRSLESLVAQAEEGLRWRKRIGLVGPAVTDHPRFEELMQRIQALGAELSISSLRIKPLPAIALDEMAKSGARTIALAPEAGSQRLRRAIRKNFSEEDILAAVTRVGERKMEQLKLYFMIGLPSETEEDIEEIAALSVKAKAILDSQRSGTRITLSVAPFVPKAGTPFHAMPAEQTKVMQKRLERLKRLLMPKGIMLSAESPIWSQTQAVLARGDERLAKALAMMEESTLPEWRRALRECGLDADYYLYDKWQSADIELPWAMVDLGVSPARTPVDFSELAGQG